MSLRKFYHEPIPDKEIKRFYELERRFQSNPAVEGQLRKLCENFRRRFLPAFRAWIANSNTGGKGDPDGTLRSVCGLLEKAVTTGELVMAVDLTIHAQHTRGIFIGELVEIKDEQHMTDIGMDLRKFRNPKVEWKSIRSWEEERAED